MLEDLPQGLLNFCFYYLFSKLQVTINKLIKLMFHSSSFKKNHYWRFPNAPGGEIYALATFNSKVYEEVDSVVTLLPIS